MEFKCSKCQNVYDVTEEHAGMEFECSNCQATVSVPENLFEKDSLMSPAVSKSNDPLSEPVANNDGFCPKCNAPLESNAIICIECGHNLKLGLNAKTVAKTKNVAKTAGKFGLAVTIAAVTAAISAFIWAWIAIAINMEIGYVAWGIGLAVGGSVIITTQERSMRLGVVAVLLSVSAILLGKLIYVNHALEESKKSFIEELKSNPEIQKELESYSTEEREELYKSIVDEQMIAFSYFDRIKATCSPWDILWLILAVSSAWKMATGASDD